MKFLLKTEEEFDTKPLTISTQQRHEFHVASMMVTFIHGMEAKPLSPKMAKTI
jgi:hypothetical protein